MSVRSEARRVQQAPEMVRGVRIRMAECRGLDARVQAYEEAEEVGCYGIGEAFEVGVLAWWGVAF